MALPLAAALLALLAVPASAQDHSRHDLVRGLCEPDGCDEFTILAADRVRTTDEGTLFKTRIQTFHASSSGRKERGQDNGYVYCSRTKPAIMADQNGQVMAFFLAPFATQESRESVRKSANFHALYFTICHGRDAGKAAVHNLAGVAQSHDYRVALAKSNFVALKRAEDVVSPTQRPTEEARLDERRERPPVQAAPPPVQAAPPPVQAAARTDQPAAEPRMQASPPAAPDKGFLAGARRLTNRAFDAMDGAAGWVVGGRN